MSQVTITPIQGAPQGQLINMYDGSENGYLRLVQKSIIFSGPWPKKVTKSCFLKGDRDTLQLILDQAGSGLTMPGRIHVQEYVTSQVPAQLKKDFFVKENGVYNVERSIELLAKKAGSDADALVCTLNGEPILRFSTYDQTGSSVDVTVQHDNGEQISQQAKAKVEAEADLVGNSH